MNVPNLLRQLAERLPRGLRGANRAASPVPLRYVLGFAVLFGVFLALHVLALRLPQLIRAEADKVPGLELLYTDATLELLPPALTLADVSVGGALLGHDRLQFRSIRLKPSLGAVFMGRAALLIEAAAVDNGRLQLEVAEPLGGGDTQGTLRLVNWPLTSLASVLRFDPRAQGSVSLEAEATVSWQTEAGRRRFPRACDGFVQGAVRIDSMRNGLQGLLADRFENGQLTFAGTMAGRVFTLQEARLTATGLDVTVAGKAVMDWRVPRQSELNLVADITTAPEMVSPQLLTPVLRERLASGQTLPVGIQGTLFMPAFAPVQ